MDRALLTVGWMATAGFVATGVIGYRVTVNEYFDAHLLLGLASALLLLFSHSWIMFYLIGTGKVIKEAVAEHDLDQELIELTKEYKNRSYPSLMLAMGLAMATFIIGGAVATLLLPAWTHQGLFWLTVIAQARALWWEHQVLGQNRALMSGLNRTLVSAAEEPAG